MLKNTIACLTALAASAFPALRGEQPTAAMETIS